MPFYKVSGYHFQLGIFCKVYLYKYNKNSFENIRTYLQSSPIYVDSCEDSYEDEDCSCDSSSSYDVLHSRYVRKWQESAET